MIIGLVGISGVGKSFLRKEAQAKYAQLEYLSGITTRPPRFDEKDGVDKFFLSIEKFQELHNKNELILIQNIYNNLYAFYKRHVESKKLFITELLSSDIIELRKYTDVVAINIYTQLNNQVIKNLNNRYNNPMLVEERLLKDLERAITHEKLRAKGFFNYIYENKFDKISVTGFIKMIGNILQEYAT